MSTDDPSSKTPQNNLSLTRITDLRGEAHATIRRRAAEIISIGAAVELLDAALMLNLADRTIDDQQQLVTAARRLAFLLDGEAAQ